VGALGTAGSPFPAPPGALHLRAALEPLLGCLYALAPLDQEVLALRAGLGGYAPVSRGEVARAFGVSSADIQRTERSGLRQLRSASHEDGCMAVAGETVASAGLAFLGGPFGPIGFAAPTGASAGAPIDRGTTAKPADRVVERPSLSDSIAGLGEGGNAGSLWVVLLITTLFCASAAALAREVRRSV
jgi:hypothetical protein